MQRKRSLDTLDDGLEDTHVSKPPKKQRALLGMKTADVGAPLSQLCMAHVNVIELSSCEPVTRL